MLPAAAACCLLLLLPSTLRSHLVTPAPHNTLSLQVMAAYIASQAAGGSGALPSENTSMATEAEFVAAVAALARGLYQFDIVMGEEGREEGRMGVAFTQEQGTALLAAGADDNEAKLLRFFLGAWLPSAAAPCYRSCTLLALGCPAIITRRHICRHLHLFADGALLCLSERQQRRQHLCSSRSPSLVLCPAQLQRPERQRSGHAGAGWAGACKIAGRGCGSWLKLRFPGSCLRA